MTVDLLNQHLAGLTSFACAAALSFIVLTRRIKEGVIIKAGLILMIAALLASGCMSYDLTVSLRDIWNATMLLRVGLLMVLIGYVLRVNQEEKGA